MVLEVKGVHAMTGGMRWDDDEMEDSLGTQDASTCHQPDAGNIRLECGDQGVPVEFI